MNRKERRRLEKAARTGKVPAEMTIPEAIEQAISLYERGQLRESLRICRNLLGLAPGDPDLLHLAGTIAAQIADPGADELLEQAIEADPGRADTHYNLGNAYRLKGRMADAAAAYERAVGLDPNLAEAYNNLGIVRLATGQVEPAVAAHARSVEVRPDHASAQCNLAIALHHAGRTEEAEAACRRAIALMPGMAEAHNALGNILKFQGRTEEALAAYGRAIELNPAYAEAHSNLGLLYHEQRHLDRAIEASRRAIELMPTLMDPYKNLGYSLQQQGRHDGARQVYDRAQAFGNDVGIAVRKALLLPLIPASTEAIDEARAGLSTALDALETAGTTIDDPARDVAVTNFFLAYHGLDDRPLQERLARFYLRTCPALAWTAPHLENGAAFAPGPGERIRVGFMSRYLVEGHTIGKLFGGLIGRLSRDRFETVIFRPTAVSDPLDDAVERSVVLSESLAAARERIAVEKPHVLIYTDIGMEPLSYFLAFSRLAPVQCVTWGHPVTTGIPSLDRFLSSVDMDTEDADAHYSESLERLPRLSLCYRRPEVPANGLPGRRELGLPEDRHLYVCTQTLFKLHPDFDAALADILARDPDGVAVFIGGPHSHMVSLLRRRMAAAIPDADERLIFLPALSFTEFLGLSAAADVLLDSLHFSGGNTTLEGLGVGTPVVTWPSEFARGRLTAAICREFGIDDLIARDAGHYAELAVRIATDPGLRAELSARIRAAGDDFFENGESVDVFADFLERAVR